MKKRTLSLTDENTDECLQSVARTVIQAATTKSMPSMVVQSWNADALYDQIVAIHAARVALRRMNARKRGSK